MKNHDPIYTPASYSNKSGAQTQIMVDSHIFYTAFSPHFVLKVTFIEQFDEKAFFT